MKLTLLPLLFLAGCATYANKDGVIVASNASYVEWHGGTKPSLVMYDVDNGTPTRAVGAVAGTALSGMVGLKAAPIARVLGR